MCVASNLAKRIHGAPVAIDQMPQAHPGRELFENIRRKRWILRQ